MEYLKEALGLIHKHSIRLERLARDKHSSLLRIFINYGHKFFYNIGPELQKLNLKKKLVNESTADIAATTQHSFGKMSVGQMLLDQMAGHQKTMLLTFPFRPFRRRRRPIVEKRMGPGAIVIAPHYLCNLSILQKSPCFEPGACIIKLITAVIYGFRNKLERLSLASISSLVQCLETNTLAYCVNCRLQL